MRGCTATGDRLPLFVHQVSETTYPTLPDPLFTAHVLYPERQQAG